MERTQLQWYRGMFIRRQTARPGASRFHDGLDSRAFDPAHLRHATPAMAPPKAKSRPKPKSAKPALAFERKNQDILKLPSCMHTYPSITPHSQNSHLYQSTNPLSPYHLFFYQFALMPTYSRCPHPQTTYPASAHAFPARSRLHPQGCLPRHPHPFHERR